MSRKTDGFIERDSGNGKHCKDPPDTGGETGAPETTMYRSEKMPLLAKGKPEKADGRELPGEALKHETARW